MEMVQDSCHVIDSLMIAIRLFITLFKTASADPPDGKSEADHRTSTPKLTSHGCTSTVCLHSPSGTPRLVSDILSIGEGRSAELPERLGLVTIRLALTRPLGMESLYSRLK